MKAARLHNYDESVPPDSLKVEEIEEPKIEGPFDVIVRVGAAGLRRTDIHIIEGQWAPIQDPDGTLLPYVLGHENAGWVEEVGSGVTNVSVGDTVICHPLMILAGQTPRSVWASPGRRQLRRLPRVAIERPHLQGKRRRWRLADRCPGRGSRGSARSATRCSSRGVAG